MKFASHYIIDILEPSTQELVLLVEDRMGGKHHINCLKTEYNDYSNVNPKSISKHDIS